MEDFYYAGGLPAMLKQIESKLDLSVMTVDGQTWVKIWLVPVSMMKMLYARWITQFTIKVLAVLRGNLAPDGAVMKPAAAEARLHKHTGPALSLTATRK